MVKSRVVIFGSINLMAGPALLELHESDPFLFYFKVNFYSLFLQWRSSCLKVKPAWNVSRCTFHEPRRTLSKWVFILSHIVLFFLLKRSFGGKVPLETTRFSHTLLNLPQTFVKELKGINRRNSSVERFTWDTSVIFAVKANQSYRHNSVCTRRPWGSTAPKSVCNTLITLEEDKRIVFSHGI